MRNCFVPNCDRQSRSMVKRRMFQPPKCLEKFQLWKSVLPKRREFKPTDRVCQRHFDAADIETTWDHMIGGKLVQMERAKAKLKSTAVPKLNLICTASERTASSADKRRATSSAPLLEITVDDKTTYEEIVLLPLDTETEEDDCIIKDDMVNGGADDDQPKIDSGDDAKDDVTIANTENFLDYDETATTDDEVLRDDESHHPHLNAATTSSTTANKNPDFDASFELLYDDIYEVELPDTMYGIHRDPERASIVFTQFDVVRMCSSKVLHIDREHGVCRSYIDGLQFEELSGAELSVALVTKMLADLDASSLCSRAAATRVRSSGDIGQCQRFVTTGSVCTGCEG